MYRPRPIASLPEDTDADGIKVYLISAADIARYRPRLETMKRVRPVARDPAFVECMYGAVPSVDAYRAQRLCKA